MSEFLFHTHFLNKTPQKSDSVASDLPSLYYYFPILMSNPLNQRLAAVHRQYYYYLSKESKEIRPFKKIFLWKSELRSKKNIDKQITIKIQLN